MKKLTAEGIVTTLIEGRQDDMRFDMDARVEVWVTGDDLRFDRRYDEVMAAAGSDEEKKAALMQLAVDIVNRRLSSAEADGAGIGITADVSPASVNVDRVNWQELLHPEADDVADEDVS